MSWLKVINYKTDHKILTYKNWKKKKLNSSCKSNEKLAQLVTYSKKKNHKYLIWRKIIKYRKSFIKKKNKIKLL